jgi:cysteine desulfurase
MIYLDYQATTPVAPEVVAAMQPWLEERFANPHSSHRPGREAAAAVEAAREKVAGLFSGTKGSLYFTSGATEAANWALKASATRLSPDRRRIVTLATEHACVLDTVQWLASQGFEVHILPVGGDGLVDLDQAQAAIDEETGLVAAMLVNNEIGVIQPIAELGKLARHKGARFFCDAVQGIGRTELPFEQCDLVAISSHKIHGPKGVGALWVGEDVQLDPLLHGGGQERGIRSGTLSPALCVGFGEAALLVTREAEADRAKVAHLWERAWQVLGDRWLLNGSAEARYRGNLNIRSPGIDAARLISEVREVAFSSGSACASGSGRPSHVLASLGLDAPKARSSIRIGFGRYTSEEELVRALSSIEEAAARQKSFAA